MSPICISALLLALASSAVSQSSVAQLVAQLREAPTQVDRINLLSDGDVSASAGFLILQIINRAQYSTYLIS